MGPSTYLDPQFAQPELNKNEVLLRTEFAKEFCWDYNAIGACIRIGILAPYAEDWAQQFMTESVTRLLIRERQKQLLTEDNNDETQETEIIQGLRECGHFKGPDSNHGSRVTAWLGLAKIKGMLNNDKEDDPGHGIAGGVMIVPAMVSAEEWAKDAAVSQEQLKLSVKE